MTTDEQLNAKPYAPVFNTTVPEHWLIALQAMAKERGVTVAGMVRSTLLAHQSLAEQDAEAEKLGISTLAYRQRLIKELFPDLPPWNLPFPKPRRILTAGRKNVVGHTKPDAKVKSPVTRANQLAVTLPPKLMNTLREAAAKRGKTPEDIAVIAIKALAKQFGYSE